MPCNLQSSRSSKKPELMSPAGHWPQLHAAIEAGADAVYFGLTHFSARAKAGFNLSEMPEIMRTLHSRGVRGFITFNTLVFEHELSHAAQTIAAIAEAGADALIVQDLGVLQLAHRIAPEIELHASTQMSVTDASGVRLAQDLGASRVTLARELSLDEVRAIRSQTDCELEIFVHGALCVAYSGQCFSSEAWGGRSANRGQCAQACRLPYELMVDGAVRPLADARYLLSPGDLYTLREVPEIVAAGVSTLKIEGRYKDAEYVALTTHAYRQAIDDAWANQPHPIDPAAELALEQIYSRGLGPYFLSGTNHQAVVKGRAPRHRGVLVGRVVQVLPEAVIVETNDVQRLSPLKPGDGLVFDAADWRSPEEPEEGGRLFELAPRGGSRSELRFGNGAVRFARIRPGDLVWRTADPELEKAARLFTNATSPVARQAVNVRVTAHEGAPLEMAWQLARQPSISITVRSPELLSAARNRGITIESAREQLARLGSTPYELADLELDAAGSPFVPASVMNQMRRDAVDLLQAAQSQPPARTIQESAQVLAEALDAVTIRTQQTLPAELHLLVRTPEQLDAALTLEPASITLDYLDLYGLRPSIERVRASGIAVRVASPRILKPGEGRIVNFLLSLNCPILVRAGGILHALQASERPVLIGDFSLNAANALTAKTLLDLGLTRITPTHDLNADQISDLARRIGPGAIEAVAYQHLPIFHTEHCVFCRFLSNGTSYRDCGRPCEKHRVALKDQNQREHPVMADVGCRNTVFGAEAQEASAHLKSWRDAGISHFRLEFVHETAAQVREVTQLFAAALSSSISYGDLARQLKRLAPGGITEGSLFVPTNYLTLPVLQ
jgi:putative protease